MPDTIAIHIPLKPYQDKLKQALRDAVPEELFVHHLPPVKLSHCAVCKSEESKYSLCAKCGWVR